MLQDCESFDKISPLHESASRTGRIYSELPDVLVSIHQPHYLAWLPYLGKIARSDIFLLLDDVEFTRNGWQNRNKIKTSQGALTLTVPVRQKSTQWIQQVEVAEQSWRKKHWSSLVQAYRRAPYFETYAPQLEAFWAEPWSNFCDPCCRMIEWLIATLELPVRCIRSSSLSIESRSSLRLVQLVGAAGGSAYLSGSHALQAYLEPEVFRQQQMPLHLFDWTCPPYAQLHGDFVPNLATLDALLNLGPSRTADLCRAGGTVRAY